MSTALMTTAKQELVKQSDDSMDGLAVSAGTPEDMLKSQHALVEWCDHKISRLQAEQVELQAAYEHATKHKWKSATLKKHADIALKRVEFYVKIKAALLAGYFIVPNFPVTAFAVRTDKKKPLKILTQSEYSHREQCADRLPVGEGDYKNPRPLLNCGFEYETTDQRGNKQNVRDWYAADWDQFEFPLNMAKVEIMEAATKAMALKVFDDLGVLPSGRNEDPVIVGRIVDPRSPKKWMGRHVTFLVAWHLDTRTL